MFGIFCLVLIPFMLYKRFSGDKIPVVLVPIFVSVIMIYPTIEFTRTASNLNSDLQSVKELDKLNECIDEYSKIDYDTVKEVGMKIIEPVVFVSRVLLVS